MSEKNKRMMQFAFCSDAAEREYKDLPETVQDEFDKALRLKALANFIGSAAKGIVIALDRSKAHIDRKSVV